MNHPPYHLRTNKAVDRLLFVNVLQAMNMNREGCSYYSLAGPFLEDLRVMDLLLPKMRLVSLERDAQTYKRQEFHRFSRRIVLLKQSMSDFLARDYDPSASDVFWLDYTGLEYSNFSEFQRVLKMVLPGSVVRITLRGEPEVDLEELASRHVSVLELERLETEFQRQFEDNFRAILPHPPPKAYADRDAYARGVQQMVERAASSALDSSGSDTEFLHIQSSVYNDNTQMLSVTGAVVLKNGADEIRRTLAAVGLTDFDWPSPTRINIPALSAKERLHLERHLPAPEGEDAGLELLNAMDYHIGGTKASSRKILATYARYYREYPNFIRTPV